MTHKIKTFEDACKALKLDPKKLPVVTGLPKKHCKSIVAYYKLTTIAEALNEGWTPDWSDEDQPKYNAWFQVKATKKKPSGSGFSCSYYDYWDANTVVGSRLCFKSSDLALYAGKQFKDLYKDYLLMTE